MPPEDPKAQPAAAAAMSDDGGAVIANVGSSHSSPAAVVDHGKDRKRRKNREGADAASAGAPARSEVEVVDVAAANEDGNAMDDGAHRQRHRRHLAPASEGTGVSGSGNNHDAPVRRERSGLRYSDEPPVPATASPAAMNGVKRGHHAAASSYCYADDGQVSAATSSTSSRLFRDPPPHAPPRPPRPAASASAAANGGASWNYESASATAWPNGVFIGGGNKVRARHHAAGSSSAGGAGGSGYAADEDSYVSASSRAFRETEAAPAKHHSRPPKPKAHHGAPPPRREHGEEECRRLGVQAVMAMSPAERLAAVTRYQLEQKAAAEAAVGKKAFSFWPTDAERDFDLEEVDRKVEERKAAGFAKGKRRQH